MLTSASVKIMKSYDYCHFEVILGIANDNGITLKDVGNLVVDAQRLTDKAVKQYKTAQEDIKTRDNLGWSLSELEKKAKIIYENFPMSEWTTEQKAIVKAHEDAVFRLSREYDYEDDWEW